MELTSGTSIDSFRPRFDGAAISTYVLAMLSVPVKLWCRSRVSGMQSLGWDDFLCVVTLIFSNGWFWVTMIGIRPNLGRHVGLEVSGEEVEAFLKNLYAAALLYCLAIAFIKFTILAFYWKLFSIAARIPIIILAVSVGCWLVILLCLCAFGCRPISAQWDVTITDATCIQQKGIYLGGSLPNVLVDFVLVFMPLPYVWRLRAPVGQRLIIVGMFTLGLFVCIVSAVRLSEVMAIKTNDKNITYNLRDFMLWSIVEVNIGIVCSCLPSMRRLLTAIGLNRLFSKGSSADKRTGSGALGGNTKRSGLATISGGGSHAKKGPWNPWSQVGLTKIDSEEDVHEMTNQLNKQGQTHSEVETGHRTSGDTALVVQRPDSPPKHNNGIVVQRDWTVQVDHQEQSGK
ncbi:unnamed protein product [Clonostachys byssicola]|uniref:Rhodopsin domain-containing protein n=1 Tax=Clonostachys byssicola TaxID=160290 RepID=A0A9N9Y6C5_9HYPO|nr:unnamed protein product [Clonostachys byssicola]